MSLKHIAWSAWALVPVGVVAYHFGPGQTAFVLDRAAQLQRVALVAEHSAMDAQLDAHALHLAALDARRSAFLSQAETDETAALAATAREDAAYAVAADAWAHAAEQYFQVEEALRDASPDQADRVLWSKGRAMVRAGDIWNGITELESLLERVEPESELAQATREELAAAHYYGARLMRLSGEPAERWRPEAAKARQHYRYLAEQAEAGGDDVAAVEGFERNVEVVLNLEQQDLSDVVGKPLPKNSPRAQREGKCQNCQSQKKDKRPPQKRDGRGAGGAGEIGRGW